MVASALLADLDGTLIDTRPIDALREARQWRECVRRKAETSPYEGVRDLLVSLRERGVSIAIVTSSVSYYAEALLSHHQLPYDSLTAYHDTREHKPAPEPYLRAIRQSSASAATCIGIGDTDEDLRALKAAGVFTVGAGWSGHLNPRDGWDTVFLAPADVLPFVLAVR